ncbi:hypothetical protein ASPWEDRAFT_55547 [Aspergillus wentii DTO 134E9]|uniref:C2H2-type domain-containing protein n=1 Tax=Aspergillus wentii DTO 134E9 TaxID=1073089 RepID=A0A1L9R3Y2_ASPWE|nr:uncharacterized protein ASPWEDRAFT_55547 [Aspergillus wentii DTO 134E9]OJJ29631.1 hypothetical protein ASPWEDRAFT_55547 [Aspergillus wentii DTO 134E9]
MSDSSDQECWLEKENQLDEIAIKRRNYSDKSKELQGWVWRLWLLYNFWDYTITKRRKYIDAASTLQTYWNVWTTERRKRTGLSIPDYIKDDMKGVRERLVIRHQLRTDPKPRPHARSEDVFELQKTLWTTGNQTWDPLQLAVFMLLAGPTAHRRRALLTLRHCDIFLTLLPDPGCHEWPQIVVEVKPDKTKRYRCRRKRTTTISLLEVPGETCLFLCPKTFLLGLLVRKAAFRDLDIVSAEQLYDLRIPPDARQLSLKLADPEAFLFNMTESTLDSHLRRLGELAGYDHTVTSKWFRRGGGEAVNSSTEISEAQQNLLMQHRTGTVYQDNYAPDHLPADVYSVWRGLAPQREMVRMTSGQSRTIRKDRPVDLTDAQKAEAMNDPDVQRRLELWVTCKAKVAMEYGNLSKAKGTQDYQEALQRRNKYHAAVRAAERAKKREVRAHFNEEQPVTDVRRQVHGLPFETASQSAPNATPPEQYRAFEMVFRFAPSSPQDNRRCRVTVINALSQVKPRYWPRAQQSHIQQTPSVVVAPLQESTNLRHQPYRLSERQCLWCVIAKTRLEPFKSPYSLYRHICRLHINDTQAEWPVRCPDAICGELLSCQNEFRNHMAIVHGSIF